MTRNLVPTVLGAAAAYFMLACSRSVITSPPSPLSIVTDRAEYFGGDRVRIRFTYAGSAQVSYNDCRASLEQLKGKDWVFVTWGPGANVPCTAHLGKGLKAGESAETTFGLPADLPAGTYRYDFDSVFSTSNEPLVRVTNSFTVR